MAGKSTGNGQAAPAPQAEESDVEGLDPSLISDADEEDPSLQQGDEEEGQEEEVVEQPSAPPVKAVTERPPAQPKPQAQQPVPQPAQPQVQSPPAKTEAPQEETLTPQRALELRQQWRENSIKELTAHYKIPEKIAESLDPDTAAFLPTLAARVYIDSVEATMNAVLSQLPTVFQNMMANQTTSDRNEDEFYAAYPALDRGTDHEAVLQIARAFRQANPQASKADFIKQVGAIALYTLGKQQAVEAPAPRTQRPQSFRPARTGGGRAPAPKPLNEFEQLAEEFLEEDRQY